MNDDDPKATETPGDLADRLDRATAERLSKLRTLPVDTSRLDQLVGAQLPASDHGARRTRPAGAWFSRPVRAAAAVLLIVGVVAAVLLSNAEGPALASPALMAQVHDDVVSGRTPVMQVSSVDAANRMLGAQWPDSPGIPSMPADHVMACCMKSVKHKKVACVLLRGEQGGEPVTMTVARASDMSLPKSPTVVRNGVTYHVQDFRGLSMVMTERNERWICLIGRVPADHLMDLAAKLAF
jgi:hypothetical protein